MELTVPVEGITERGQAGYALTPRGRDLLAWLAPLDSRAAAWAGEA